MNQGGQEARSWGSYKTQSESISFPVLLPGVMLPGDCFSQLPPQRWVFDSMMKIGEHYLSPFRRSEGPFFVGPDKLWQG